jgi:hypothetical protein
MCFERKMVSKRAMAKLKYVEKMIIALRCENKWFSLRPILIFANIDVSRNILVIDTSILAKSNMGQRDY